jgi:hypothetical protein
MVSEWCLDWKGRYPGGSLGGWSQTPSGLGGHSAGGAGNSITRIPLLAILQDLQRIWRFSQVILPPSAQGIIWSAWSKRSPANPLKNSPHFGQITPPRAASKEALIPASFQLGGKARANGETGSKLCGGKPFTESVWREFWKRAQAEPDTPFYHPIAPCSQAIPLRISGPPPVDA